MILFSSTCMWLPNYKAAILNIVFISKHCISEEKCIICNTQEEREADLFRELNNKIWMLHSGKKIVVTKINTIQTKFSYLVVNTNRDSWHTFFSEPYFKWKCWTCQKMELRKCYHGVNVFLLVSLGHFYEVGDKLQWYVLPVRRRKEGKKFKGIEKLTKEQNLNQRSKAIISDAKVELNMTGFCLWFCFCLRKHFVSHSFPRCITVDLDILKKDPSYCLLVIHLKNWKTKLGKKYSYQINLLWVVMVPLRTGKNEEENFEGKYKPL